jgi:plastocyanin
MALRVLTPTLAICLAAGIAAGIGLARPDLGHSASPAPAPVVADAGTLPPATAGTDAYGNPIPAAPADPSAPADPGTGSGDAAASITISNFDFGDPVTVAPGATVQVSNSDGEPHTVTADKGAFDTGQIDGGSTGSFTAPTKPGTYKFFCGVHPSMTGSLVVQG